MHEDTLNQVQTKYNMIPMWETEEKDQKPQKIDKKARNRNYTPPDTP